jgi:uncharacterized membrane protein YdjX (TVP38/TMEM64 family)
MDPEQTSRPRPEPLSTRPRPERRRWDWHWQLQAARAHPRRVALLLALLVLAAFLTRLPGLHEQIAGALEYVAGIMAQHPVLGAIAFVVASALSAMLLFFSSVLLVPLGIELWGSVGCFLLLWGGWFLGGVLSYTIGRYFGRPAVESLLSRQRVLDLEQHVPAAHGFWGALMVQLAFPSDVAGYFFGLFRFPRTIYLVALACAELPFALGTVFLGTAFIEQAWVPLLVGAAFTGTFLIWQWRRRRGRACA